MRYGSLLGFLAGLAVGSVVTWKVLEKDYREASKEEIDDMELFYKERYEAKLREAGIDISKDKKIPKSEDKAEGQENVDPASSLINTTEMDRVNEVKNTLYSPLTTRFGYDQVSKGHVDPAETVAPVDGIDTSPVVIDPDEGWHDPRYSKVYLTYYNGDGILVRDETETGMEGESTEDDIVRIDNTIGYEALNHFGEYELETVYVRNDCEGTVYCVTRDSRSFSNDILGVDYVHG